MATERYDGLIEYLEREITNLTNQLREARRGSYDDDFINYGLVNSLDLSLRLKKIDLDRARQRKEVE